MFAGTLPMSGVGGALDVPSATSAFLFQQVALPLRGGLVIAAIVMAITLLRLALAAQSGSPTRAGRRILRAAAPRLHAAPAEPPKAAARVALADSSPVLMPSPGRRSARAGRATGLGSGAPRRARA